VEAFAAMLERLSPRGVLCVTRWARTPPRDALRVLTTLAEALRRQGLDPPRHLAMIRSWATVTILAGRAPIDPAQTDAIRAFCRQRGFDLCHLPDLAACEVNRYHVLQEPDYYRFTKSLLGPGRERFLADYAFDLIPPTDDRPYFFNFLRLRYLPAIKEQLGGLSPAYLELGTLMLLAALGQTVLLAAILIVLPLVPRAPTLREAEGKAAALAYFILLGAGFMFLEMGFLQRLILYLGHPIYSAAAVISSFLVFAGLGSRISQRWQACPRRIIARASGLIVILALAALAGVHLWLPATQAWPTVARFAVAALLMGPLAFVMGQMFPSGLRALAGASPAIVPWAWAVNGFSSVAATISAPLLAMKWGFSRLALIAVGCYALAGLLSHRLPGSSEARLRADG